MMDDFDDPSSSDGNVGNEDDANSASSGEHVGQMEHNTVISYILFVSLNIVFNLILD
jgi:hypothetical protein